MEIPHNCMECPHHKLKGEVGDILRVFCYGGLRPKAKPFRIKEHKESTPRWCPIKRRENNND